MPFTIRDATPHDAADVVRLILELANFERLSHEARPDKELLERHLSRHASPRCEALLAEDADSGRMVGFAIFFQVYSTFLTRWQIRLEDLYVVPDLRGMGVGRALLARVARIAVDRDCERVEWSVLDWNTSAVKFYRDLGATDVSEWVPMRLAGEALENLALTDR
jgi:diamine N-acetyltransferase